MKILIVGAGAVGCFYGAKLTLAGEEVTLLTRGKTFEQLKRNPVQVKSYQGDFSARLNVEENPQNISSPDLFILAIKSYDTDSVIKQIQPVICENTTLMSLQNGVENEEKLIEQFGEKKVLGALCYIGAEVTEPGKVIHSADGKILFGELNSPITKRTKKTLSAFQKAKIETHLSENIKEDLWKKFLWNTGFNQVCTVASVNVGELLDSKPLTKLLRETMLEVVDLAKRKGVKLSKQNVDQTLAYSNEILRAVRPSMLQDAEKNKKLEHETFSGYMIRSAMNLGIQYPINQVLHQLLSHLSQ